MLENGFSVLGKTELETLAFCERGAYFRNGFSWSFEFTHWSKSKTASRAKDLLLVDASKTKKPQKPICKLTRKVDKSLENFEIELFEKKKVCLPSLHAYKVF